MAISRYCLLIPIAVDHAFLCLKIASWPIKSKIRVWTLTVSIQFNFLVNRGVLIGQIDQLVLKNISAWSALEFCRYSSFLNCGFNIVATVVNTSCLYVGRRCMMDYKKLFFNTSAIKVCNWGKRFGILR